MSAAVEVVDQLGMGRIQGPVAELATAVLDAEGSAGAVVVAFVDEASMIRLNGRYRGLEEPTDVLSFRDADAEGWDETAPDMSEGVVDLGEVAVCPAVVCRYAVEEGGDARRQLGWTLVHGLLHLVGYDHEVDNGEMRRREQELLGTLEPLVEALPVPRRA